MITGKSLAFSCSLLACIGLRKLYSLKVVNGSISGRKSAQLSGPANSSMLKKPGLKGTQRVHHSLNDFSPTGSNFNSTREVTPRSESLPIDGIVKSQSRPTVFFTDSMALKSLLLTQHVMRGGMQFQAWWLRRF